MLESKRFSGYFSFSHFRAGVWITIVVRFLSFFSFSIFGPYFMLYLSQDRGLSLTFAGMIVAFSSVIGAFSQILGGIITDRFGRRRTLLLFYGLGTVLNILLTLMIASSTSIWLFSSLYIISGLSWGMTQPALTAVITDLAPREKLTEAFGLAQLIANIGWIIGPLLGGYMFAHLSFTYLYGTNIITGFFSFILILLALHESFTGNKDKISFRNMISFKIDKALFTYILLNLMVYIVYVQIVNIYSVFTVDQLGFTTTQYGFLMTINAIILVVFQHPVTRFVDIRLGDKNALIWGSVLFGAGYLSLSWITGFGWSVVYILVVTMAELLFIPSMSSVIGKLAEPEQRGRYLGFLGTGTGLGIAIGPVLGGALYDGSHGASLLLWGPLALITFVAGIGFLRWFSAYKKRLK
jgi:MFS family permease